LAQILTAPPYRVFAGAFLALLLFIAANLTIATSATIGLGGLMSEKVLGRSGVVDSTLVLGTTANQTLTVLAIAPATFTQAATNLGLGTATLNGTITSMNAHSASTGYFQWGYGPTAGDLTNTTTTFPANATGGYSSDITGVNLTGLVYYRFVSRTDDEAYGTITPFLAGDLTSFGYVATLSLENQSGGALSLSPIPLKMNPRDLIAAGMLQADAEDWRPITLSNSTVFLDGVAQGVSSPDQTWWIDVPSQADGSTLLYEFHMGDPM